MLAHVGQPEYQAGVEAGERLGRAGVQHALCVNQENGNVGPRPALPRPRATASPRRAAAIASRCRSRCRTRAPRSGGWPRRSPAGPVDGIVTLGPGGAKPALDAVRASGLSRAIKLATFDLSPDVLAAVRDGKMLFAVDQQPYLQGYLPVILLAERARYGVFPGKGELIPTGPKFVTKADAAEVIRLSAEGIR